MTVCWDPQLCRMLVECVKETTPPARFTKDSTPSSIIQTVGHSIYSVQFIKDGEAVLYLYCFLFILYYLLLNVCASKAVFTHYPLFIQLGTHIRPRENGAILSALQKWLCSAPYLALLGARLRQARKIRCTYES